MTNLALDVSDSQIDRGFGMQDRSGLAIYQMEMIYLQPSWKIVCFTALTFDHDLVKEKSNVEKDCTDIDTRIYDFTCLY